MSRRLLQGATAAAVAALTVLSTAIPAFAHEQRTVGAYRFTVGWQHEPTYTGILNGIQLILKDANGTAIDDLGMPPTLHVTVSTGTQTSDPLDLEPSFDPDTGLGAHGEFDAEIIPTTPGTYTFRFTGTLNGQKIDEKFTSSDSTFNNVEDPATVEFPVKLPNTADMATNLTRLNPRVDAATVVASRAHDKANTATTLALVALVVGAVLGIVGIVLGVTGRRRQA
jgi:hypothetical protein